MSLPLTVWWIYSTILWTTQLVDFICNWFWCQSFSIVRRIICNISISHRPGFHALLECNSITSHKFIHEETRFNWSRHTSHGVQIFDMPYLLTRYLFLLPGWICTWYCVMEPYRLNGELDIQSKVSTLRLWKRNIRVLGLNWVAKQGTWKLLNITYKYIKNYDKTFSVYQTYRTTVLLTLRQTSPWP